MVIDAHAPLFHPRWYPAAFFASITRDFIRRQQHTRRRVDAERAQSQLMLTDDTGQTTVRLMDKLGIDRRVILVLDWGLALGEPSTDLWQIHREILGACNNHRDRLIGFAGVDPRRPHSSELIRWAFDDLGAQGLKLHPTADWTLGDERRRHVVELAAQRALPVVVHVGQTVDVLSDRNSQPDAFLGLARAFPKTSFIAGHSGFELWKSFTVNQNVPRNIYFDVSGWQEAAARDADGTRADLGTLLKKFPGRVCYGTASPLYS